MKVVFVGPSLPDARDRAAPGIEIRPPACQGDVMRAIRQGATAIGLIDGLFEFVAPVWHKELLYALCDGIPVMGAASMGALRAAECAAFGMTGIGRIFEDYRDGRRVDDGDVALLHGPAELGYPAVTIPIVNIDATLERAHEIGLLGKTDVRLLASAARGIFFKERRWDQVVESAGFDWREIGPLVARSRVDQKRQDALALLVAMTDEVWRPAVGDWEFRATPLWRKLYS